MLEKLLVNQNPCIMKIGKLHFGLLFFGLLLSSCYTEVIVEDDFIVEETPLNAALALETYDLWYVDINASRGSLEIPFLQRAFTISFNRGIVYANNNLVGIGKTGNGLGIDVGAYDMLFSAVEIDHDLDGLWLFDVIALNGNTLELRDPSSGTAYILRGYQRNTFDYDLVFYDNINYFLEEYSVWEKTFTSEVGALNEFDDENYLEFVSGIFRSSVDAPGIPLNAIQWDYEGNYQVFDVTNDPTLKTLTLDYDFLGNDYFELYVIDDGTIELYHVSSGTVYEFTGRGFQQYLKSGKSTSKMRVKQKNPVMDVKRQRKM